MFPIMLGAAAGALGGVYQATSFRKVRGSLGARPRLQLGAQHGYVPRRAGGHNME